jgi:cell division septum initiation protein DivIVA
LESDRAPELPALRQLEQLVHNLGEELAAFRKRAHAAEQRVRALEAAATQPVAPVSPESVRVLERENAQLRARLAHATERTNQLLSRVRFLRQQNGRPAGSGQAAGASS